MEGFFFEFSVLKSRNLGRYVRYAIQHCFCLSPLPPRASSTLQNQSPC
jgi:hypothetical protein